MANAKIQPFTSLDQSKHHCYTLSTTCTLFKLASEVGPRTKAEPSKITLNFSVDIPVLPNMLEHGTADWIVVLA